MARIPALQTQRLASSVVGTPGMSDAPDIIMNSITSANARNSNTMARLGAAAQQRNEGILRGTMMHAEAQDIKGRAAGVVGESLQDFGMDTARTIEHVKHKKEVAERIKAQQKEILDKVDLEFHKTKLSTALSDVWNKTADAAQADPDKFNDMYEVAARQAISDYVSQNPMDSGVSEGLRVQGERYLRAGLESGEGWKSKIKISQASQKIASLKDDHALQARQAENAAQLESVIKGYENTLFESSAGVMTSENALKEFERGKEKIIEEHLEHKMKGNAPFVYLELSNGNYDDILSSKEVNQYKGRALSAGNKQKKMADYNRLYNESRRLPEWFEKMRNGEFDIAEFTLEMNELKKTPGTDESLIKTYENISNYWWNTDGLEFNETIEAKAQVQIEYIDLISELENADPKNRLNIINKYRMNLSSKVGKDITLQTFLKKDQALFQTYLNELQSFELKGYWSVAMRNDNVVNPMKKIFEFVNKQSKINKAKTKYALSMEFFNWFEQQKELSPDGEYPDESQAEEWIANRMDEFKIQYLTSRDGRVQKYVDQSSGYMLDLTKG